MMKYRTVTLAVVGLFLSVSFLASSVGAASDKGMRGDPSVKGGKDSGEGMEGDRAKRYDKGMRGDKGVKGGKDSGEGMKGDRAKRYDKGMRGDKGVKGSSKGMEGGKNMEGMDK
jgi:hypothetical protein